MIGSPDKKREEQKEQNRNGGHTNGDSSKNKITSYYQRTSSGSDINSNKSAEMKNEEVKNSDSGHTANRKRKFDEF